MATDTSVSAGVSGDNVLVDCIAGDQIEVYDYGLYAAAPVLATLKDEAGTVFGIYNFIAASLGVAANAVGHSRHRFATNGRLILGLGGAVAVTGHIKYTIRAGPSVFNPKSLAPIVWLKADADTWQDTGGTTAAVLDAATIALWKDQSGFGNHVSQATGGNQPLLKLRIQNIRSVVRFDGVDDFLANVVMTAPNIPYTVYVVHASSGTSGQFFNFQRLSGANSVEGMSRGAANIAVLNVSNGAGSVLSINGTPGTPTAFHIFSYGLTGNNTTFAGQIFADGTSLAGPTVASGVRDNTVVARNLLLGALLTGASPNAGDIAEVLVYPFALSSTEDANVRSYLKARWGTP